MLDDDDRLVKDGALGGTGNDTPAVAFDVFVSEVGGADSSDTTATSTPSSSAFASSLFPPLCSASAVALALALYSAADGAGGDSSDADGETTAVSGVSGCCCC